MEHPHAGTTTVGLVLAAGAGTRYGMPKILVPGWLDGAVHALREGGCAEVVIVTGRVRPVLPPGTDEAFCVEWERGIGASLRTGLLAVVDRADRLVIHVVDCPDVGPDVVARVLRVPAGVAARAVFEGRPGHPVALPSGFVQELLARLHDHDGAGPFLRSLAPADLELVECGDLATGQDQDYADGSPGTAADQDRGEARHA